MVTAGEPTALEQVLEQDLGLGRDVVARASAHANEHGLLLVEAVIELGLAEEDVVAEAISRAARTWVVDLEQGTIDRDAARLLDPSRARALLALPIATDSSGKGLRVAFADPLDATTVAAVAESTGRDVTATVATVSSLRAAMERAFATRDTQVIRERAAAAELSPESTRLMQMGERADLMSAAVRTTPIGRVEDSATVEQRVEALVLALIEAGALTRADYVTALTRLLGKR